MGDIEIERSFQLLRNNIDELNLKVVTLSLSSANENEIADFHEIIETDIAQIEYILLPSQTPNKKTMELQFELNQLKNRFKSLKISYRRKMIEVKTKERESLYFETIDCVKDNDDEGNNNKDINDSKTYDLDDEKLKKLTAQERLLKTNTQLTDKLQNVSTLMKSTILASELNMAELESSNASLVHLGERYGVFGDMLQKTNALVSQINKASKRDRVMIYRAIYFFIGVSLWIIWRRLLKKPIKLLLWIALSSIKLLIWGGSKSRNALISNNDTVQIIKSSLTLSSSTTVMAAEAEAEAEATTILDQLSTSIDQTLTSILKDEL